MGEPPLVRLTESLMQRREHLFLKLGPEIEKLLKEFHSGPTQALLRFAKDFDGIELEPKELFVDPDLIHYAHKLVSSELRQAIDHTIARIERFQQELRPSGFQAQEEAGVYWGVELRPLERVGIYVPKGYLNALLLSAVPARIAKVEEMIMATPPDARIPPPYVDPALLYVCKVFDIDKVIVSGGVGALAAMAAGTEKTRAVEKIVGPTGQIGMVAKQYLSELVAIDGTTGPMEAVFLCDSTTSSKSVGADVLGISERNPDAKIFVLHPDEAWLRKLVAELVDQVDAVRDFSGREGIRNCLDVNTHFIQSQSMAEGAEWLNRWAPGIVVLPVDDAAEHVSLIKRCGGVLMGRFTSPVSLDLYGGAIGIVPTLGAAASVTMSSPASFLRRFSVIEVQKEAVQRLKQESIALAVAEGFATHQGAFKTRDDERN